MNEPKTTVDRRFSDTDAVSTGWDETRRLLETAELFWIVTVRADGRPMSLHSLPCGSTELSTSAPPKPNRKP